MHFTIKDFSEKTGIPPSKLRFYDKKGILQPSNRLENGYRAYSTEQVYTAKMIDSLRSANISIQDIKRYNDADLPTKNSMLDRWRVELDNQIKVLHTASKYLGGMNPNQTPTILLTKWEKPKTIVWQEYVVPRVPEPFKAYFAKAKNVLEKKGIPHSVKIYVRTKHIKEDKIIGEIGFEVSGSHFKNEEELTYESIPPTLFAVMENCRSDDAFLCFSYMQMVVRYGFQPDGSKIERYANIEAETFDYLIPLVK
ncbi:helix-turn-helix domain-containing protein [Ornithinibacillus californiensis]|uniref:helix-turn-helix domain-containing protein n=1 Tax=Ornithinibacillus californiensis TaxID=161536 RepID=UPI00064DA92D|nr:MerR family transcriptional regulator [Ornithinibacillus californiensis]